MALLELPQTYWLLSVFRVLFVFIPQLGYIHPDEYFQSIEVLAGRAFEVENNRPWEFNSTFPIRSMTLPYFTIGFSYSILNFINTILKQCSTYSVITPYFLLVAPRFLMCILSFIVDFSLYKICVNNNEKYKTKLIVLASSYVTFTYSTRTFSNTLELILFSLLLYYVSESLIFSNILIKKREYLNYRCEKSTSIVEKVKYHKLKLYLTSDSVRNCLEISTITVMGFFNRPTFLLFALFPVFFWLYRGLGNKLIIPMTFHLRMIAFLVCAIPALVLNVLVDSFYYSYLTWGEIGMLDISINNFVFTPLNFVKYNIDASNLAKHGLHPRFLHVLVNMPLLFNILALFAIYAFFQAFYNLTKGQHQLLPTVRSIKGLMMLAYLAPLGLLSVFPHQEPRFIIPIILPLVYLFGSSILPESDNILVKKDTSIKTTDKQTNRSKSNALIKLWLILNAIFLLFYGFIHQGGVYQSVNYLSNELKLKSPALEYHIVTSHIYSIPESLFLQKSSNKLYFAKTTKYSVNKRVFLYEMGSLNIERLLDTVQEISNGIKKKKLNLKSNKKFKLLLIIAGSLDDKLYYSSAKMKLNINLVNTFYPHLSTEAFPELDSDLLKFYSNFNVENLFLYLYKFVTAFSLKLYEIDINYT